VKSSDILAHRGSRIGFWGRYLICEIIILRCGTLCIIFLWKISTYLQMNNMIHFMASKNQKEMHHTYFMPFQASLIRRNRTENEIQNSFKTKPKFTRRHLCPESEKFLLLHYLSSWHWHTQRRKRLKKIQRRKKNFFSCWYHPLKIESRNLAMPLKSNNSKFVTNANWFLIR